MADSYKANHTSFIRCLYDDAVRSTDYSVEW
jgi:hypothetical protein